MAITYAAASACGLDLEPANHSFTYTYPPPKYCWPTSVVRPSISSEIAAWADYSLYLHVPFCRMSCRFCSLHRELADPSSARVEQYVTSLEREVDLLRSLVQRPAALYVGGGTPTILPAVRLGGLIERATRGADRKNLPEVTVEIAPEPDRSFNAWIDYFGALRDASNGSPTRVSVGIESFDEVVLTHMGRRGGAASAIETVRAVDACFDTYNVDLLLGYTMGPQGFDPETSVRSILSGIDDLRVSGIRLPSVSIYQMWDVGEVPSTKRRDGPRTSEVDMFAAKAELQDELFARGYGPSPGATFTLDGAVHEWTYHRTTQARHVGLGSGSYSFLPAGFVQRPRDINAYVAAIERAPSFEQVETALSRTYLLTEPQQELRRFMMGIRSIGSTELPHGTPHGLDLNEFAGKIDRLIGGGILLLDSPTRVSLSKSAFLWSNEVSSLLHPPHIPRRRPSDEPVSLRRAARDQPLTQPPRGREQQGHGSSSG